MKRWARSMLLAVIVSAITALSVWAGGWAVITLDHVPGQIVAKQAFTIGFTVRQHGRTLRDDLSPIVRFDRADAGDSISAAAKREGESGHYVASVMLPSAGEWKWKVDVGLATQDMATLTVVAAPAPSASSATTPASVYSSNSLPIAAGALGSIVALGAVAVWLRTRARWALVLLALAALVGVGGFATASTSVAQPEAAPAEVTQIDQVAEGRVLFSDKGCVMCHAHPEVKTTDGPFWIGEEPPDLGSHKYTAVYLQHWLKDPSKIKPETTMPNLHLSDAEIAALSAFLDAK